MILMSTIPSSLHSRIFKVMMKFGVVTKTTLVFGEGGFKTTGVEVFFGGGHKKVRMMDELR